MCGIPFHATEMYFYKLLDAGIRIAIDDDDLTPKILLPNTGKQEKRFVVVESEDLSGDPYEVWDGVKNAIHIDEDGNRSTFITRWQAEDFASELNRWEYEKTRDRSGELFYEDTESEESTYAPESDAVSQKYDLGFGFLGNGLTVWNRLQEEHGDYKTIAHIDADRTVHFYDRNIPESIKKRIYEVAATSDARISATQDTSVFSIEPDGDKQNDRIAGNDIGLVPPYDRYSIRLLPFEGGITGIWDNSIKKYYGEGGQLFRFAEQNTAIEFLNRIQRESGIPEVVIFTTEKGTVYHPGDHLIASFDEQNTVQIVIDRVDEDDVWYTMPSEPGQDAVNMERMLFEKYLDEGNIRVLFSKHLDSAEGISINDETLNPVIELAKKYGANIVRIGAENSEPEKSESEVKTVDGIIYEQYQKCKEMYPRRLAMIQHGNNYYFFGKDADKVQHILKSKPTETYMVNGEQVSAFVVPLLEYSHSVFKLENKGMFLVHANKDSIIPVDYFIKGHRVGTEVDVYPLEFELATLKGYDIEDGIIVDEDGYFTSSKAHYVESKKALEKAMKCIEAFCAEEYKSECVDFSDLSHIGIGYTTITDSEIPIQTVANLRDYKIEKYLDGKLVEVREYDSLQELTENELENLTFEDLMDVSDSALEKYKQESQKEIPQLAETSKPRKNFPVYNSHPEIPDSEKHNYRITDDEIGMGGAKEKFRKNIDAIKLLYQLEAETRLATPDEQEILAQYSGWGGIADAFDETKDNWHSEYNELKSILSPEEYEAARDSTLTAFFTPPVIIKAMYKAIENMGFKRGNILEPSCGVGNFMGLVPESMDTKMYGVEIDSIAGRIARQLYQKNGITISGYEKTDFPDSFFDIAIGNVPFNDIKLLDKKYDKYNFLIHDYFFGATRS